VISNDSRNSSKKNISRLAVLAAMFRFPGREGHMKAYWIVGVAMAAGLNAYAEDCVVTVYVRTDAIPPAGTLSRAEAKATEIFHTAGVTLRWRTGALPAAIPADACGAPLVVRLENSEGVNASPEALAYAAPFVASGTCIHVLLDRVLRSSSPNLAPTVLAYVLVHEITHMLQRTNCHSRRGIMKANWDGSDYRRMEYDGLAFAPEDVELIRSGIASRMQHAEPK
jgi:hypothetical protein